MATGLVEEKTKHAGWVEIRVAGTYQLQARQPVFLVPSQNAACLRMGFPSSLVKSKPHPFGQEKLPSLREPSYRPINNLFLNHFQAFFKPPELEGY